MYDGCDMYALCNIATCVLRLVCIVQLIVLISNQFERRTDGQSQAVPLMLVDFFFREDIFCSAVDGLREVGISEDVIARMQPLHGFSLT